jgi:hypothetical protein
MATIRAYTTIEQSRKLAEILPLESADMEYMFLKKDGSKVSNVPFVKDGFEEHECCYIFIPCWSLAALLGVLPNGIVINKDSKNGIYHVSSTHIGTYIRTDNPVDACYEMIIRLNELNLL